MSTAAVVWIAAGCIGVLILIVTSVLLREIAAWGRRARDAARSSHSTLRCASCGTDIGENAEPVVVDDFVALPGVPNESVPVRYRICTSCVERTERRAVISTEHAGAE